MLWHAWHSVCALVDDRGDATDTEQLTGKQRKRYLQRKTVSAQDDRAKRQRVDRIQSGRTTLDEEAATFIYRCPHAVCRNANRTFKFDGLFNHM